MNKPEFSELGIEEQLGVIADIILEHADLEANVMAEHGKSSITAFKAHSQTKYWENVQTNLRRLAELEAIKLRRGI